MSLTDKFIDRVLVPPMEKAMACGEAYKAWRTQKQKDRTVLDNFDGMVRFCERITQANTTYRPTNFPGETFRGEMRYDGTQNPLNGNFQIEFEYKLSIPEEHELTRLQIFYMDPFDFNKQVYTPLSSRHGATSVGHENSVFDILIDSNLKTDKSEATIVAQRGIFSGRLTLTGADATPAYLCEGNAYTFDSRPSECGLKITRAPTKPKNSQVMHFDSLEAFNQYFDDVIDISSQ